MRTASAGPYFARRSTNNENIAATSSGAIRSAMRESAPAFVAPMAARLARTLPEGKEWLYELKFDGHRALLLKHESRIEIRSRNNKDLTAMYPRVVSAGLRRPPDRRSSTARSSRSTGADGPRFVPFNIVPCIRITRSLSTPSTCCTSTGRT